MGETRFGSVRTDKGLLDNQWADSQVIPGDGAITIKNGDVILSKGSAAAITLAAPVATTDDFKRLRIMAVTAFAHVLTGPAGGFNGGGAGVDVGTWAAAKGNNLELLAYQGVWYILRNVGVTLS